MKRIRMFNLIIVGILFSSVVDAHEYQGKCIQDRLLPVTVTAVMQKQDYRIDEPIVIQVDLKNDLKEEIFFERFSLQPNDWNGETLNVELPNITRNNINVYEQHPVIETPITVAGTALERIAPGETMRLTIDISKWKIRDGWIRGKYSVVIRLDNIIADKYSKISVISDPITIEIK